MFAYPASIGEGTPLLPVRKLNVKGRVPYDTIIGLDCSLTDTGIVASCKQPDGTFRHVQIASTAVLAKLKDPLRQAAITMVVLDILAKHVGRRVAVVIEDYAFGRATGKVFTRAELIGAIKYITLTVFGFDLFLVSPKALKKFMGSGNNEKEDMVHAAHMRFSFVHGNDNVIDAFCLTRYLIANLEGQLLTLVKHSALPHYAALQVPANMVVNAKNPRLTIPIAGPTLPTATGRPRVILTKRGNT